MGDNNRYQCFKCKAQNLRSPFQCSNCGNLFHKSCLEGKKTHKLTIDGKEICCMGESTDLLEEYIDIEKVRVVDQGRMNKRKRGEDDIIDVSPQVELIMRKIEESKFDNEEVKKFIREQLIGFRYEIMEGVKTEIENLRNEIFSKKISEGENQCDKNNLYAEKVKMSKMENIVIVSKDKQNSEETLNQVKSKINVGELGVSVDRVKKTQGGKVLIRCTNKEDSNTLERELKNKIGPSYNIQVPKKKLPKIKIVDVEDEIINIEKNSEVISMICKQNDMNESDANKIEIKKKFKGKSKYGMMIVEVDPKIHRMLLNKERINIGWSKCRVFDCISVLRCYKCCGYHHFAKDCQNETKCRKCAENHLEKDCNSQVKKCVNCVKLIEEFKLKDIKVDHCANDD